METIAVKKKDYIILKELGDHSYLVEKEGKRYFLKVLGAKTEEFSNYKFSLKRLKASGVNIPKIVAIDKKQGAILSENIEGDSVFSILLSRDLDDEYFKQIFDMNYLCKMNRIAIDYNPHNFILSNGMLYYISDDFKDYTKDLDFTESGIRLWFYTKDFRNLLTFEGYAIDQSRIKNDFEQNKEITLKVVKFYR